MTITVTNLGADFTSNGYLVYIYSDSDATNRDFTHTVNSTALTVVEDSSTFNGTFDEAVTPLDGYSNYVVSGVNTSGTLTITTDSSAGRSAINGFQIVAVPEPSSTALFGLGALALTLRRRK